MLRVTVRFWYNKCIMKKQILSFLPSVFLATMIALSNPTSAQAAFDPTLETSQVSIEQRHNQEYEDQKQQFFETYGVPYNDSEATRDDRLQEAIDNFWAASSASSGLPSAFVYEMQQERQDVLGQWSPSISQLDPSKPIWDNFRNANLANATTNHAIRDAMKKFYKDFNVAQISNDPIHLVNVGKDFTPASTTEADIERSNAFKDTFIQAFKNDTYVQNFPFDSRYIEEAFKSLNKYFASDTYGMSGFYAYESRHSVVGNTFSMDGFVNTSIHETGHVLGILCEGITQFLTEELMGCKKPLSQSVLSLGYDTTFERALADKIGRKEFWDSAFTLGVYQQRWDQEFGEILTHRELTAMRWLAKGELNQTVSADKRPLYQFAGRVGVDAKDEDARLGIVKDFLTYFKGATDQSLSEQERQQHITNLRSIADQIEPHMRRVQGFKNNVLFESLIQDMRLEFAMYDVDRILGEAEGVAQIFQTKATHLEELEQFFAYQQELREKQIPETTESGYVYVDQTADTITEFVQPITTAHQPIITTKPTTIAEPATTVEATEPTTVEPIVEQTADRHVEERPREETTTSAEPLTEIQTALVETKIEAETERAQSIKIMQLAATGEAPATAHTTQTTIQDNADSQRGGINHKTALPMLGIALMGTMAGLVAKVKGKDKDKDKRKTKLINPEEKGRRREAEEERIRKLLEADPRIVLTEKGYTIRRD